MRRALVILEEFRIDPKFCDASLNASECGCLRPPTKISNARNFTVDCSPAGSVEIRTKILVFAFDHISLISGRDLGGAKLSSFPNMSRRDFSLSDWARVMACACVA
jgi:hypothetical protein